MKFFANFSYIINFLILCAFIIFKHNKLDSLFFNFNIGFIIYFLYLILHHYTDALQNTTRNIARVYLMKKYEEPILTSSMIPKIQIHLTPDSYVPLSFFYVMFHISYFAIILFTNGWLIAIILELLTFILMFPINYQYQFHLVNFAFALRLDELLFLDQLTQLA